MNKLLTGMVVLIAIGLIMLAGCAQKEAMPPAPTGISGDVSSIDNDLAALDDNTGIIDTAELDTVDEAVG